MKAKRAILAKDTLPEPLLKLQDPAVILAEITQAEIVAFSTASHIFRLARADFEAKRAALTMKLLRCCHCEEGDYFALLDERDKLVVEGRTSLEVGTGRPILDRDIVPSGGAA
jgi:hypothetical protein